MVDFESRNVFKVVFAECDTIGDVSNAKYMGVGNKRMDIIPIGEIFCDNIVVWCPCDASKIKSGKPEDIGSYYRCLRKALPFKSALMKMLGSGTVQGYDIIPFEDHVRYSRKVKGYKPGYVSFKIGLADEMIHNVIDVIKNIDVDFVYIHDIDITIDCLGITTRSDMEEYLVSLGVDRNDIVSDLYKVGHNCISWWTTIDDVRLRAKVYNKFVQMLESSEVRSHIGSRISDIVANSSHVFQDRLVKAKDCGLTRVEMKVFKLYDFDRYKRMMDQLLKMIKKCKVCCVSFEEQWKALIDEVYDKSTVVVYIPEKKIFIYCHWYNKLTMKKQGCVKKNIRQSEIHNLLANYSFNDRIMEYFEMIDEKNLYVITTYKRYQRVCDNYTLVPGPNNSLYPSIGRSIDAGVNSNLGAGKDPFVKMGLVPYRSMSVGWPLTQITHGSTPLSKIKEIEDNVCDRLQILDNIMVSQYRAGYAVLVPNTVYKIIAIGKKKYRGKETMFAKLVTLDNTVIKVRCGEEFTSLITNHNNDGKPFSIKTGMEYRSHNKPKDIYIEEVLDNSST